LYTLDQLQQKIHLAYEGNTDYPSSGEEDYTVRTSFINDAIHEWEQSEGQYWKELFTTLAVAATGDKTASVGDTTYNAPGDFMFISSYLKITGSDNSVSYYRQIRPDDFVNVYAGDTAAKVFYITDNPSSGYVININNPKAGTISYSYYKQATELSNTTDKPEMSMPYFIIYHALLQLYELDNRTDMITKYSQMKNDLMKNMINMNETLAFNNSNPLTDLNYQLAGGNIGE